MVKNPTRVYRSYRSYLKERYGTTANRIAVDAGFSCPNRGPDRRRGGCTYCDERGSRAVYQQAVFERRNGPSVRKELSGTKIDFSGLKEQIERGTRFLRKRYKPEVLILYFQAFSGTYAPVATLRRVYDYCLSAADFKELVVSTRPDCISPEKVELLNEYKRRGYDVWVELGLQSANDTTLRRIERGHTVEDFDRAFRLLRDADIKIAVHLIFGLPGEGWAEISRTIDFIAERNPEGVKIHNIHIPIGTPLYREYLQGELSVPCARRHLEYTIQALEKLPENIIILRLTCDTPEELLSAPRRFWEKQAFFRELQKEMRRRKTWQGKRRHRRNYGN